MSVEYEANVIDLVNLYNTSDINFWYNVTQCVYSIESKLVRVDRQLIANESDYEVSETYESSLKHCLKERIGSSPYIPSASVQLFWGTLHGLMIAAASIGNSMVIWIILAHRRMRTVTNLFLLNLAIADLMMALFNASFNFVYMLNSHWPFGAFYCTVNNMLANLTVFASVFTITAMSIDRIFNSFKQLYLFKLNECTLENQLRAKTLQLQQDYVNSSAIKK
ncbi:tachykinin-like peptides receptor 86C [Leptotrombidium deliense]|uniref:Tachykinin-like peptides receptor 86C n=1 Tax=Leptotrombidium deliense TaxID=299467 RepID=A0A443SEB1_9ACAR|nr:tachykinin-like peptides receptor 86C [Leptotrombidium deliense]